MATVLMGCDIKTEALKSGETERARTFDRQVRRNEDQDGRSSSSSRMPLAGEAGSRVPGSSPSGLMTLEIVRAAVIQHGGVRPMVTDHPLARRSRASPHAFSLVMVQPRAIFLVESFRAIFAPFLGLSRAPRAEGGPSFVPLSWAFTGGR